MKKIIYNYLKPQQYYLRLFNFFILISFSLVFTLFGFNFNEILNNFDLFLLKFFIILFLILVLASTIEFFNRGEYISPIEIYEVESFFNNLKRDFKKGKSIDEYFLKYPNFLKTKFRKIFYHHNYFLSSIRKIAKDEYELIVIDQNRYLYFFIFRFLIKVPIHKIIVKEFRNDLKIVYIN